MTTPAGAEPTVVVTPAADDPTPGQEISTPAARRRPQTPPWVAGGLAAVPALVWLALRPSEPHGVAAVVDLLVLPAVLLLEVRVLSGRSRLTPAALALFFGLGAVFAAVTSLVLERATGFLVGSSAVNTMGPVIEAVAICAPAGIAALGAGRRAWSVADTTLAALATGLGFLVVQASLATSAVHAAPDYVSPFLAGYHWVPSSAGSPTTYFAGPALAAAFVGASLGLGLRLRSRALRLAPAIGALALVIFDHELFAWRLRNLVASRPARTSGLVDVVQTVALQGRLALVLLAAALVVARLTGGRRSESAVGEEPGGSAADAAAPDAGIDAPDADSAPKGDGGASTGWIPVGAAVAAGVALTLLARSRQLEFVDHRALALSVSVLGLGYSLWHLPAIGGRAPGPDVRLLLAVGALLSSGLGVVAALLPDPRAPVAPHGSLILATVLGWGAHVGNVGFVLGLGGFAAPPGEPGRRLFGDRWSRIARRRLAWTGLYRDKSGGTTSVLTEHKIREGTRRAHRRRREERRSGHGAEFFWFKVANTRLGARFKRGGARYRLDEAALVEERHLTVAIEPIHGHAGETLEFVGATVKEALEAAMREVGADLAHSALQLVDDGQSTKRGKPGPGRPARVRVTQAGPDVEELLLPPARDSILQATPFAAVVHVARDEGEDAPESVHVTLRSSRRSGSRTLTCTLVETTSAAATYRSNPYSLRLGEDTTMAGPGGGGAAEGLRVQDGDDITVELRGASAVVTVYDDWATQVLGVNRRLFDVVEEHHGRVVDVLEEERERVERVGGDTEVVRRCVQRLRARLAAVEEGRRLLSAPFDDVTRAFTTTAALDVAMSVDDVGAVVDRAAAAVRALPAPVAEASPDPARAAFCEFLRATAPGILWAQGAYSVHDIARILGWDRFADDPAPPVATRPADPPEPAR